MKVCKLLVLFLLISLVVTNTVMAESKKIFEMNDPLGDDYGAGTYIYPQHQQFKDYQGLFDLSFFKVMANEKQYIFYFKFKQVTNPWHAPYGFSHQLIQVYIDNSDGGSKEVFKQGANVKFEKQHPWNQLLKITGWNVELFNLDDKQKDYKLLESAAVKLEEKKVIKVTIPRKKLKDLSEAYYYVLVGSLDGFNYDNYRKVTAEGGAWNFGGGTDSDLNPNVIDTLVPEGLSQKQVLGSFDTEEGQLATLRAVGPELALPWKLVIIFAFSIIFLLTIFGIIIKFINKKFIKCI
ncbi:glucodextranase DOMON-like domain-containing protein [Halanaerobacter jeridensis]|uniref:Carbohydrate-binding DOMON domain-containing protein n=1 Tax=Halanaerobacter jeridensis TaxID=706427 RepID=A0A939BRW6_9FIRM|nr:glucodextranase DOMON-like domain-containing protein [Halanaerobacter jeridensis]MBM7557754.1 carbohydrate-binding DOMON domain-containing protein [Halanaerobacter jeridensis]